MRRPPSLICMHIEKSQRREMPTPRNDHGATSRRLEPRSTSPHDLTEIPAIREVVPTAGWQHWDCSHVDAGTALAPFDSGGCAMFMLAHGPATDIDRLDDIALCARVAAEFREMPGLRITLAQAVRLFSIDRARCERVLRRLVDRGELSTDGRVFVRVDVGRRYA